MGLIHRGVQTFTFCAFFSLFFSQEEKEEGKKRKASPNSRFLFSLEEPDDHRTGHSFPGVTYPPPSYKHWPLQSPSLLCISSPYLLLETPIFLFPSFLSPILYCYCCIYIHRDIHNIVRCVTSSGCTIQSILFRYLQHLLLLFTFCQASLCVHISV